MQQLQYELSILAKAVQFKNLSAAASQVGLSQPQLSRIMAKIEAELQVILLDRSAKRKSSWTPIATQIAELFEKNFRRLESDLQNLTNDQITSELHIGTLEGLSELALKLVQVCFQQIGVHHIELNIYDLNELESHFQSGHLDLIFTMKEPGLQKYKNLAEIGFQQLEEIKSNSEFIVYSSFEYGKSLTKKKKGKKKIFVSNSLSLRKQWLEKNGGTGLLPSDIKKTKSFQSQPVLIIANDLINPVLWQKLNQIKAELTA